MKYYVNTVKENIKYLSENNISNINVKENSLSFETNEKSLKNLLEKIENISYYNKRKLIIITFFKKYCITLICLLIFCLFLINEQFVIKEIVFINENTYNQEIENYLYQEKLNKKIIYYYLNDSLDNINRDLKQKYFFYEWINIYKKGNILQINIDKQDEKSYLDSTSNIEGDIVSSRDGIIRYYFIKKGVNLIKDNQSISKGDVLVSGNLLINNNEIDYIHPIGIVLAEVVEKEMIKIEKNNKYFIKTGKIFVKEKLVIFNLENNNFDKFDMFEDQKKVIFDYKFIKKIKYIYYEIKEINNFYNKEEAIKYSYSIIEKKFNENKIHNKEKILDFFMINIIEDNEYYYIEYLIKKIMNISEFKPVNLEDK